MFLVFPSFPIGNKNIHITYGLYVSSFPSDALSKNGICNILQILQPMTAQIWNLTINMCGPWLNAYKVSQFLLLCCTVLRRFFRRKIYGLGYRLNIF